MPPFFETEEEKLLRSRSTSLSEGEKHPDPRHPLYVGFWKRSIPYVHKDFARDDLDEPHLKRKHTILSEHPEVEKLYGTDIRTFYITVLINVVQLSIAYVFGKVWSPSWYVFALVAYFIGGTLTGMIGVIIHEACHCLVFKQKWANRYFGLFANIALPVPIAQSFRRYHIEHHTWQGVEGMDPDLPLDWEKALIQGNAVSKFLWIMIYPVMYVVRGAVMQNDRNLTPSKWEVINMVFTVGSDILIQRFCGWTGLAYLFFSLWFGYSLHPGAAHFVQEHYTFDDGQETYSYYGILNIPFMNIGYHNEHHDFQKIPWSKLPALRSLAGDYYNKLAYHTSWLMVHWRFISEPSVGPQSRVIRSYDDFKKGRSLLGRMRQFDLLQKSKKA